MVIMLVSAFNYSFSSLYSYEQFRLCIITLFDTLFCYVLLVLGRIHAAVVSSVNLSTRSVTVEWSEKGETKGKEVTAAVICVSVSFKRGAGSNKKAQLSLTNPRDACEKFARFT